MTARVLVLASDLPPLPGVPAHGGGLRGWTLARGLAAAGHAVTLRFPRESLEAWRERLSADEYTAAQAETFPWREPLAGIAHDRFDVVVASSWLLASQIAACPVPLAVDLAGPVLLEFLAQGGDKALALAGRKTQALTAADFVTCAGERQRDYFAAWCLLSGFAPDDCLARLAVVPISCDPALPVHAPPNAEPRLVFAGLPLAWQDPVGPLDAVLTALERRGRGRLDVYMAPHPVHSAGATWFGWLRERVGRSGRAALHAPLPYGDLLATYRDADLAFDLFARTLERELAFNTRTVDYLRCGVVPLYADYAELSTLLREYDAGLVVDPADRGQVTAAVERVLDHPALLEPLSANAQRLARERLAWDRTVAPLAAFCAHPSRRRRGVLSPRALVPDLVREAEGLRGQVGQRDAEIARLRDYIARLEREWAEKGWLLAGRDAELAAWRRAPWRRALRQTLAAVGRVGRRGRA